MSNTKKWKGGDREVKPEVIDSLRNPEDPNYILTDAEFQKQGEEKKQNTENKKEGEEDWEEWKEKTGRA